MPKAEEVQVIVELTHHTLHALRAVNGTAEAGGECALENGPALEALLGAVSSTGKADGVQVESVWPDGADWHVSSDTEAMLDRAPEALRAIAGAAQGSSKYPFSYAACSAEDGGAITPDGTEKWVLAHCPREALARACGGAAGCKVAARGAAPAAFAQAGGIARALRAAGKGCVALWDLGSERSHLLLVTAGGVAGAAPCAIGLNTAFEAVQTALKLKFRGAGARLFFNEGYDFTEPGPRIGAILGASLKQALALLPQTETPPELACVGLTGRQAWFIREVAAAAGTSAWAPDLKSLAGYFGLTFADDAVQASFSPASIGVFGLLSLRLGAKEAWKPAWAEAEAPAAEAPVAVEEPPPVEEPAPAPARPKPVLTPEGGPAPPVVLKQPKQAAAPKQEAPAPEAEPAPAVPAARPAAQPTPARMPPAPAFSPSALAPPPEPAAAHPGAPAEPPAFPFPAAPGTKPGAAVVPGVPGAIRTSVPAAAEPAQRELPQPKSKVGFYVGAIAAGALIFAAIAIALDYRMQKIKEKDREQQEALAHHLAEVRVKEAPLSRSEQPETPAREAETAPVVAPAQEAPTGKPPAGPAPRPVILPGAISVATVPAGASVSIDGAAPLPSPVRAEGIAPGTHRVRIALAGHDPVEISAEVRSSRTTDLGTVSLKSSFGRLEITSSPDGLAFVVHTAADPTGKPVYAGRAPAKITDVAHGDYLVTFTRPGCHDHVESATVAKGATTPVDTKYLDGSLELESDPSGAWVDKDGMRLGSTPLVLHDLTPKAASFELTLPGYDPTPLSCEIPEGQTLKVTAHLLRRDRIFEAGEVKTLPVSYESPAPELGPSQVDANAEVLLSFVVQRDGTVIDVKVEKTTDDDIGRRCATALTKWRFHPATAADDRTVDVRMEMPFKFPASSK